MPHYPELSPNIIGNCVQGLTCQLQLSKIFENFLDLPWGLASIENFLSAFTKKFPSNLNLSQMLLMLLKTFEEWRRFKKKKNI